MKTKLLLPGRSFTRRAAAFFFANILILGVPCVTHATWRTLVDGSSLNSSSAFANSWNYNYPWGNTHNGSARMYSTNISFSGGVATTSRSAWALAPAR